MNSARKVIGGLANQMFMHAYLVGKALNGDIPDVYVQSMKYWKQYADIIRSMYSEGVKPGSIAKCSLHIRRGDYVGNTFYVDLTATDYYQRAVAEMDDYWTDNALSSYDGEGWSNFPTYLVFCKDNQGWETDKADREWCRQYLDKLIPGRYELVDKNNLEHEDMNLMASCLTHIGANSSFSWMAAFIGGGKTIMPKAWFTEGATGQPVEMLPEWHTI